MLQSRRSLVQFPMKLLDFSVELILPATPWLWRRLSIEQKRGPGIFPRVNGSQKFTLTSISSVSRLSGKCGILDASHPYGPIRPVRIIPLPLVKNSICLIN
jgi:hypothetical protein